MVAYHDTQKHKPSPDPIFKAIENAGVQKGSVFHVGDMASDTEAAKAAGVTSLGALWGSLDPVSLRCSGPDHIFSDVGELSEFLLG